MSYNENSLITLGQLKAAIARMLSELVADAESTDESSTDTSDTTE